MRARGVDVSAVQGEHIDFGELAGGGFDFVSCRATVGATGQDFTCALDVAHARAAGLLVASCYHVLTTTSAVADQAINALRAQQAHGAPIALDFEVPPPEQWAPPITGMWLLQRAVEFCNRIEAANVKLVVYSYPYFLQSLPFCEELLQLADRPLWLADYHDQKHPPAEDYQPKFPQPWDAWSFIQWSGDGGLPAPGVPMVVDHDVYNGSRGDLAAWLASS
jgi:GH25 family lysozyme M1 (1,4-beta-N-acetylmuramidase)